MVISCLCLISEDNLVLTRIFYFVAITVFLAYISSIFIFGALIMISMDFECLHRYRKYQLPALSMGQNISSKCKIGNDRGSQNSGSGEIDDFKKG